MNLEILKQNPFCLDEEALNWVQTVFKEMSEEEKIGQVIQDGSMELRNIQRPLELGGFHRMVTHSPKALRDSAEEMQKNARIPKLLSADMDHLSYGINPEGTPFTDQMGVAACDDPEIAWMMGIVAARECKAMGFNWSFTPVVDINYNFKNQIVNIRSFGSDPDRVLRMASAYVKGMQGEGVAACLKHWPGDGIDDRDQHNIPTVNSLDMDTWRKTYGRNYRQLIREGVMTIMSAHIMLPAYYREKDPAFPVEKMLPGSLSKELNLELLRGELGFNGLIITDATNMGGYGVNGRRRELLPMSIENGCDMLMFVKDYEEDIRALKDALNDGKLSRRRLDEAVTRVLGLKAALGLHRKKKAGKYAPLPREQALLGCEEHRKWASKAAERSITLVKDTQRLLPVLPDRYRRVLLIEGKATGQFGDPKELGFAAELRAQGFVVTQYTPRIRITSDQFDLIIYAVAQECIMVRDNTRMDMIRLMGDIMSAMERRWDDIPLMFISFGSPYHLYDFPYIKTFINAYSSVEPVKKAAAEMITGKKPFFGKNPVDPFCGLESARL